MFQTAHNFLLEAFALEWWLRRVGNAVLADGLSARRLLEVGPGGRGRLV